MEDLSKTKNLTPSSNGNTDFPSPIEQGCKSLAPASVDGKQVNLQPLVPTNPDDPCLVKPPVPPANNQDFLNKIDDSKLKPCMQTVLNSLKNLSGNSVADIIKKFSGNTPGYNWVMQDGNTSGAAAITKPTYDRVNQRVTTTFDGTEVSSGSDLAIAKTILHESVHAYLVTYFGNDPLEATKTYAQMVNDYKKNGTDVNSAQHDEIVRDFIVDIGVSLKAYGISQGYQLTDQFYKDLAWGGLQETSTFNNLPQKDKDRILKTIIGEQAGTDINGNPVTPKGKPSGC